MIITSSWDWPRNQCHKMGKTLAKITQEIFDQVLRARQALDALEQCPLDGRGEFLESVKVRSQLNAAKAHVLRAIEKAQTLR